MLRLEDWFTGGEHIGEGAFSCQFASSFSYIPQLEVPEVIADAVLKAFKGG